MKHKFRDSSGHDFLMKQLGVTTKLTLPILATRPSWMWSLSGKLPVIKWGRSALKWLRTISRDISSRKMSKVRNRSDQWVRRLASVLLVAFATSANAKPAEIWRDAFQSSPADYDLISPKAIKLIAAQYKVPETMIESSVNPQKLSGTLRYRFAVSTGGSQLRVRLSNEEGKEPLVVTSASVGLAGKDFDAQKGSLQKLTFGGRNIVTIPAGAPLISDPVELKTTSGTELVASVFLTSAIEANPRGSGAIAVTASDQTGAESLAGVTMATGRPIVTGVAVLQSAPVHVIVTLGDSITDGNRAGLTTLRSWPEKLARRLAARRRGRRYGVVNAGIGGNRVLRSGWGASALSRFDRDVLRIEGVSHIIVLEGTNDIGMAGHSVFGDSPEVRADDLIGAYRQMIARAHARNIKLVLGTITPFGGAPSHDTPANEFIRQAVNKWIRTSNEPDALIDFDASARDPAMPSAMRKDFGSVDHLHPGEAGYRAMGDAIDLNIFK